MDHIPLTPPVSGHQRVRAKPPAFTSAVPTYIPKHFSAKRWTVWAPSDTHQLRDEVRKVCLAPPPPPSHSARRPRSRTRATPRTTPASAPPAPAPILVSVVVATGPVLPVRFPVDRTNPTDSMTQPGAAASQPPAVEAQARPPRAACWPPPRVSPGDLGVLATARSPRPSREQSEGLLGPAPRRIKRTAGRRWTSTRRPRQRKSRLHQDAARLAGRVAASAAYIQTSSGQFESHTHTHTYKTCP